MLIHGSRLLQFGADYFVSEKFEGCMDKNIFYTESTATKRPTIITITDFGLAFEPVLIVKL